MPAGDLKLGRPDPASGAKSEGCLINLTTSWCVTPCQLLRWIIHSRSRRRPGESIRVLCVACVKEGRAVSMHSGRTRAGGLPESSSRHDVCRRLLSTVRPVTAGDKLEAPRPAVVLEAHLAHLLVPTHHIANSNGRREAEHGWVPVGMDGDREAAGFALRSGRTVLTTNGNRMRHAWPDPRHPQKRRCGVRPH